MVATVPCEMGYKAAFVSPKSPIGKSDIQYTADFADNNLMIRVFSQSGVFISGDTVNVFYAIVY